MSHTVENKRIRVTVTDDIWTSYQEAAQHIQRSEGGKQSVGSVIRGLVLSSAMKKLGNAAELELLNSQDGAIDESVLLEVARDLLVCEWLEQHGRYNFNDTVNRYRNGHRMSLGMQNDISNACAFADSQLAPLSDSDKTEMAMKVFGGFETPDPREVKTYQLRTGATSDITDVLSKAASLCSGRAELAYRRRMAKTDGWDIEILEELPPTIGMCRTNCAKTIAI